ncbi:helix-turn-helix domain-containing protein [Clostridium sporogenes]|uniref:helix-turn-helix domain-containing protein n=1 Tax=Clostridium sporogenes TaxID=1509 RepID=UPI000696B62B|nr:helix-turn-helix transcriptional regulator [Clostridium sporogenes]MBW5459020.1 helix-turn-helix domain-containing protein [Clostridium sporogenes]
MIKCNLSILLAERNLKITKVSNDTGISRTTLTSLANNYSQGIQFDTINTLCNYLKIGPEQLISYIPVDIRIDTVHLNDDILDINLIIFKNNRHYRCTLTGTCYLDFLDGKLDFLEIRVKLRNEEDDETIKEENLIITSAFKLLSVTFLKDIEKEIFNKILSKFDDENIMDPLSYSFDFDNRLIPNY